MHHVMHVSSPKVETFQMFQGRLYFLKWNSTFCHTSFDAFFNSLRKKQNNKVK